MLNVPSYAKIYMPLASQAVIGAVQIIHGFGEHQGRYERFAKYLTSQGYAVITSDLRGHGTNIKRDIQLGYFGDNGAANLVGDVHDLTRIICERYPDAPYFMIGHGMGALVAMAYFKKYDYFLNGLILSGVPLPPAAPFAKLKCNFLMAFKGEYHRTSSIKLAEYPVNIASWLTSDSKDAKRYEEDPLCGFTYTVNGYKTYFDLLNNAYKSGSWILKNQDIPIRIVAGSKDSCSGSKHKGSKVVSMFKAHNYSDVEVNILNGLRHDIYNDIDKDQTYEYIVEELNKVSIQNQVLK